MGVFPTLHNSPHSIDPFLQKQNYTQAAAGLILIVIKTLALQFRFFPVREVAAFIQAFLLSFLQWFPIQKVSKDARLIAQCLHTQQTSCLSVRNLNVVAVTLTETKNLKVCFQPSTSEAHFLHLRSQKGTMDGNSRGLQKFLDCPKTRWASGQTGDQ